MFFIVTMFKEKRCETVVVFFYFISQTSQRIFHTPFVEVSISNIFGIAKLEMLVKEAMEQYNTVIKEKEREKKSKKKNK